MKLARWIVLAMLVATAPALAQNAPEPTPPPSSSPAPDSGLSGSVSADAAWQDLGIAIPSFATNADVPTQASAGSTGALGHDLAAVIMSDLRNNGLFKPSGPEGLPRPAYDQVQAPDFGAWTGRGAEMLVHGYVRANPDGQLTVGCYLYDVALKQQLTKAG